MANKLDMSLDDLIKKTGRPKPAAGKQAGGKPGAQRKQQAGKPGQQQKGAGAKGAAKPAVGQQKKGAGVQLKAKGGVAKPGAGKVRMPARSRPGNASTDLNVSIYPYTALLDTPGQGSVALSTT
jgi:hypothetical protein